MDIKTLNRISLLNQVQKYLKKGLKKKKILSRKEKALMVLERGQVCDNIVMKLRNTTRKDEVEDLLKDMTILSQSLLRGLFPVSYSLKLKDPPAFLYIQDYNKYYLSYADTGALSPTAPIPACQGYTTAFLNTLPSIPQQWIFKPYCLTQPPPSFTALTPSTLNGSACSQGTFTAYIIVSLPVGMKNLGIGGLIACSNCLLSPIGETGYTTCINGQSTIPSNSSPNLYSLWVLYIPEIYTLGKNTYFLYNLGTKTFLGSCSGCWVGRDSQQTIVNTPSSLLTENNAFIINI